GSQFPAVTRDEISHRRDSAAGRDNAVSAVERQLEHADVRSQSATAVVLWRCTVAWPDGACRLSTPRLEAKAEGSTVRFQAHAAPGSAFFPGGRVAWRTGVRCFRSVPQQEYRILVRRAGG